MKKLLFFILIAISPGKYLMTQPPSPIAWYPFNGNANDAVGTVHGTVNGAKLTEDRFGNPNSAYYFDGDYDYINLGNTNYIRPTYAITITGWFTYEYPSNIGKNSRALISCTEQGGYNMIYEYDSRAFPFRFQLNEHYQPIYSFQDTILSGWHHFAATFDGSKAILYMDGKYRGKYNCWGGCQIQYSHYNVNTYIGVDATSPYEIPGFYFDPVTFWQGKIDEVKIYDVALTGKEVLDEYNGLIEPMKTWYFDFDNDGFGNSGKMLLSKTKPKKYVTTPGDCRDWDSNSYPGAPELPDGIDNNCNGEEDEGLLCRKIWYYDGDGDGYGSDADTRFSCKQHNRYVLLGGDCKNWDPKVYPGKGCSPITGIVGIVRNANKSESTVGTSPEILFFPNPANTEINVTLNGFAAGQRVELTMVQADGKVVSTQSLTPFTQGQQVRLDVRRLSAGYYLLQVKQGYLQQTKKVMIVK